MSLAQNFSNNPQYEILTENGWENFDGVIRTPDANKPSLIIKTASGKSLTCTDDHKFICGDRQVPANRLSIGDYINVADKNSDVIVEITPTLIQHTYDIFNSDSHTILANGLSVLQCDELAFVKKKIALDFWTSVFPTLSCLTADTIILTRNGFERIGDIFSSGYNPGDYFKLEGLEVWGKYGFEPVSHGYISPAEYTYIITLSNGQSIEATPEHPLYSKRNDGEMVEARDLRKGDKLRVDKGMMIDFGVHIGSDVLIQTTHENPEMVLNISHVSLESLLQEIGYKIHCDSTHMMTCFTQVLNNYGYNYHLSGANKLVIDSQESGYRTEWVDIKYIGRGSKQITYDFTVPGTHTFLQNGILGSNTGGSCIITSTPTDDETLFADIWKKANETMDSFGNTTEVGSNGFKALKLKWDEHPERGEEFKELMIKQFGEEKFRREHELDFVAEDETLVSPLHLSEMTHSEPIKKTGQVRWYKKLDREKVYFIGYDPSLGTGGDNAAIEIFEFPTMEQVGEWMHNKSDVPVQLKVLKNILAMFEEAGFEEDNVRWTLENNSIGEAPLVLIEEYGEDEFFGFFMNEPYNPRQPTRRGRIRKGFHTSNTSKLTACTRFKRWIEHDKMTIHSKPMIKELKGFVSRGRTYKARAGDTDDLVMAMLLCVRMAMVTMQEEDEYMDILGVGGEIDDIGDDDNDWDQPLPVVF